MKILTISGSLRNASLNSMVLRTLQRLSPNGVDVRMSPSLGDLPLFNPEIEYPHPPSVAALYQSIKAADILVIASPEYAHGITGVMKNALDWMVSNDSFVDKPLVLINASPRATHAQAALRETLTVMSARIVHEVTVPVVGFGVDESTMMARSDVVEPLKDIFNKLQEAIGQN